jgi:hypothetical protein
MSDPQDSPSEGNQPEELVPSDRLLHALFEVAWRTIENGAKDYVRYRNAMEQEFGAKLAPWFLAQYEAIRRLPNNGFASEMTPETQIQEQFPLDLVASPYQNEFVPKPTPSEQAARLAKAEQTIRAWLATNDDPD